MASTVSAPKTQVLVILFPGFNTQDVNGPYEIFAIAGMKTHFDVTVAAHDEVTTSHEGVHIKRDVPLDETLLAKVSDYDILVVPGGVTVEEFIANTAISYTFVKLTEAFSRLGPRLSDDRHPRILLSICTGSLFLSALSVFTPGLFCTTHWASYDRLAKLAREAAVRTHGSESSAGVVIPARFVDSGLNADGVRIISSGGISCGIDAALYVVKMLKGDNVAIETAGLMDYAWRKTEGVVFGEQY